MFRIWVGVWACASFVSSAQTENELLNRDFWKTGPTLEHVRELVEAGNDPTSLNQFDFDPLSWALIENAETNVLEFLLEFEGNGVNKLTHDERTYVFWAAYRDNLDFMMELARRGARFDLIDEHGYSLLNFAAVTGQTNAALYDYILSQGGDPSVERNHDGAHALHLVAPFIVDEEMIELALLDIEELIEGSFLEGAPIVVTAAGSNRIGIDELEQQLDKIHVEIKKSSQPFRLSVDRCFVQKGFGDLNE